jgi:DNA-binding transcriptional MocR family regulator
MGTETTRGGSLRDVVKTHVKRSIESGALRRGSRVPSIAELVKTLDVGKNTVVLALADLCAEGVIESKERLGFFVRSAKQQERAHRTRISELRVDAVAHGMATILVQNAEGLVTVGSGTTAESVLATPEWRRALTKFEPRDPERSLRYADPLGEPRLRDVIAAREPGVSPDQVIVTYGAIEALNLAFIATAAATGSRRIGVESPGYFMIPSMLAELGLVAVPIPRTESGLDVDALRAEIKSGGPLAAVMINPNHHNPTGKTMSLTQRFELAALAQERQFFVIEDDVYKGIWAQAEEPPSVHSMMPERTLYVSSFSKTLGPALRVGFVVAPSTLVDAIRHKKFVSTLTGDAYTQNLVADFVGSRGYDKHMKAMREELSRRARVCSVESAAFKPLGRLEGEYVGGLFWRFRFRSGVSAMKLYVAARKRNVLISPGAFFRVHASISGEGDEHDAWMRVNVSRCEGGALGTVLRALSEEARA